MKQLLTTAAIVLVLTGAAHSKDQTDTILTGISQGTEEGRMLAIKWSYYQRSCPVKMSEAQEKLMSELVLYNGGMQHVIVNAKMTDEAIKSVGKDKWCSAYKKIMDLVEAKMPDAVKEKLK